MKVLFTKSALSAGVGDFLYLFQEHSSTSVALKNDEEHKQGLRRVGVCGCVTAHASKGRAHLDAAKYMKEAFDYNGPLRTGVMFPFVRNPPYFVGPCFLCSCPGVAAAGTREGRRQGPGGCCVCADDSM